MVDDGYLDLAYYKISRPIISDQVVIGPTKPRQSAQTNTECLIFAMSRPPRYLFLGQEN